MNKAVQVNAVGAEALLLISEKLTEQNKQLKRIAQAVETLAAIALQEAEQYDTTDSPPSADLSGRPLSVR